MEFWMLQILPGISECVQTGAVAAAVDYDAIGIAAAVVGAAGLIIGILLGVAGRLLAVKVNEKEPAVRELLPGKSPEESARQVAYVHCFGTCEKTEYKYNYYGLHDCRKLALIPGHGVKQCEFGCMGYGSCVKECQFDAIHIVNGVAVVDKEACVACGKCIAVCPNHLITLVPYEAKCAVGCSSEEKGKAVKEACTAGCMACGLCARLCETGAITMENNLPHIDYEKCTGCGICAEKCVQKCIKLC